MKTKILLFLFNILIATLVLSFSVKGQVTEHYYSIKNRTSVKASISMYKTTFHDWAFAYIGDFFDAYGQKRMANFKIEANYGINKFIEIGLFSGFQHYEWWDATIDQDTFIFRGIEESFAPLFGANFNFHILPFFLTTEKCRWDVYLTAKYGGCYLPHVEMPVPDMPLRKYRHEYGLGLGVCYYFKNIIGLYAEGSIGQYFFFTRVPLGRISGGPLKYVDLTDSNFSFRVGIAAKF